MVNQEIVLLSKDSFCNHLLDEGKVQSTFTIKVDPKDIVMLVAVVDQHMAGSEEDASNVEPRFFANDPQTHFVKMRTSPQPKQINHNDRVLDYSNAIVFNLTPYLAIAYEKWELTAADILAIKDLKENAIISPALPPEYSITNLEATLYQTGPSFEKMGSLSLQHVHHNNDTSIPTIIQLTVENSVIEEQASYGHKCALSLTEYGDMRSFVSYEAEWGSYGVETPLVDEFDCLLANMMQGNSRTFIWQVDNLTLEDVKSFPGKGLVLTNVYSWIDIGFGIFAEPDGNVRYEQTAQNIVALCQETDKVSMMLYSDLDQSLHTLYAQYMPLNKELLAATNSTGVSVLIDGYYPILVDKSEITANNVTRCAKFSIIMQEPEEEENAFTYYSYGGKVEIFLTVTTMAEPLGGVDQTSQKNVFERDPLQCTFGFANPAYKLTMEEYCLQVLPLDLLNQVIFEEKEEEAQRVKKEIEDAENDQLEEETRDKELDQEVVDPGADGGDSTEEQVTDFDYEMWPDPTKDVTEDPQPEPAEEEEATQVDIDDGSTETTEQQPATPDPSENQGASSSDTSSGEGEGNEVEYDEETYPDPTAAGNDESKETEQEQDQDQDMETESGSSEVAPPNPSTNVDSVSEQEAQPDSTVVVDESDSDQGGSEGRQAGNDGDITEDKDITDSDDDTFDNDNVSETIEELIKDKVIDGQVDETQELVDNGNPDITTGTTSREEMEDTQQDRDQEESSITDRKEDGQMSPSTSTDDTERDNASTTTSQQQGSQAASNDSQQMQPQSTVTVVVQSGGDQEATETMSPLLTTEQFYIIMVCLTAILLASIGACITCCCLKCGRNSREPSKPFVQESSFSREHHHDHPRREYFSSRRLQQNQLQWTREQTTSQDEEIQTARKMIVPLSNNIEADGPVCCTSSEKGTTTRMPRKISLEGDSVGRSTFDDEIKPHGSSGAHDKPGDSNDACQINDIVIEENLEIVREVNGKDLLRGFNGQLMAYPEKSTPISIEQDVPDEISNLDLAQSENSNQVARGHYTLPEVVSSAVDFGSHSVTTGSNEITPASILTKKKIRGQRSRGQQQHRHRIFNFSEITAQQIVHQTVSQGSLFQIHRQLTGFTQADSLEGTMMTALASGTIPKTKKRKSQRARFLPPDTFNENIRSVSLSPSSIRGGLADELSYVSSTTVKLQMTPIQQDYGEASEDYCSGKGGQSQQRDRTPRPRRTKGNHNADNKI